MDVNPVLCESKQSFKGIHHARMRASSNGRLDWKHMRQLADFYRSKSLTLDGIDIVPKKSLILPTKKTKKKKKRKPWELNDKTCQFRN
jgi:hypothetical protein